MKLYAYKNCSTCRKAAKWLDAHDVEYEYIAIRENPPSIDELTRMLEKTGCEIKKLFNSSGRDYRALDMKSRLSKLSTHEALSILSKNGNLVKRPFLIGDAIMLVGFNSDAWQSAFEA